MGPEHRSFCFIQKRLRGSGPAVSFSAVVDESDEQIKNRYEFGGGIEFAEGDIRAVNEVSIAWAKEKGLI